MITNISTIDGSSNKSLTHAKKEHEIFRNVDLDTSISINQGPCEVSSRESNRTIGRVVDRIETLEERLAVYEIEACTTHGTDIINNEIDTAGSSSNNSIERSRPDLSVECQLVIYLPLIKWAEIILFPRREKERTYIVDGKEQTLQISELGSSKAK